MSEFHPTHTVVGVDSDDSQLNQAALLREFRQGMEIIAWCQNDKDAEIVRRTWEAMYSNKKYFVLPYNS